MCFLYFFIKKELSLVCEMTTLIICFLFCKNFFEQSLGVDVPAVVTFAPAMTVTRLIEDSFGTFEIIECGVNRSWFAHGVIKTDAHEGGTFNE